uniref:Progesterone receptor n=1 Tax=Rana dybowskii TaxID=71582 RepID=PRGR_RANDY|nr:RecName: Full=Progesterone receptor; Short=PR; AltName: Full=Nuclear receptor subfamily 3 group C member 3; AltName: Full=dyPR [Rana dybowskii]AAN63590.1 progesterone receptor [Rana dybowskii]
MEDKSKQCLQDPMCLGIESKHYIGSHGRHQVDFLEEMVDPGEISLDSLIFQRPEDEVSYQKKGGGPASSDNNELEKVLDSILDTSSSSHLHPWDDYVIPEFQEISVTSASSTKTLGDLTTDKKEAGVWTGTTAVENKSIPSLVPKEQDTLEYSIEGQLEGKGRRHGVLASRHPTLPPDGKMPMLPGSAVYLPGQPRHIEEDNDNYDQKHLSPYPCHSSCSHHDGKIKQEDSLYAEYGMPSSNPATPGPDPSLEYICKSETAAAYDNFRSTLGKSSDKAIPVLPTSSTTSQNLYQPLSLNDHQQNAYQSGTVNDAFVPQMHLSYEQYSRPDDPDQSSQYGFDALPRKICLICSDEASGCHYGALTCGSCKVFFKRAIEGQHNYLCAGRNDCIGDKIRRKNCPSCRLKKCCQAGMVLGGRKFKKYNRLKPGRELDRIATSSPMECQQALTRRVSNSSAQEVQYFPELLQILQSIEPEVLYAGYDYTKPETPSALLCSLNQLCERQLLCVVKWSKSLPGFRNMHIDDQIILLQYSWMSLMVFAMGWRSYKHVSGQMLYFAPDLVLNERRMKDSSFYSLCIAMRQLPQEFVKLQISQEEFLCMKALLLLNTIPLEGLKSQSYFDEMRSNYIRELAKAISLRHKGVVASSQRFYHLTKVLDSMHELVKQLHLYCLNTFLQSRALSVEFPEMMTEVISAQLPKILAGMAKPLIFHKK